MTGIVGTSIDTADRRQDDDALRISEERFRRQYQGIPIPMYSWRQLGDDFVLEDFNTAGDTITGGVVRGWVGRRASELYAHEPEVMAELRTCATEQRTLHRTMPYQFRVTEKTLDLSVTYVFVPPDVVMVHTEDITERTRAEADLRHQAVHDGLTGLPNRVLLRARLEAALGSSQTPAAQCALLLLDLDRFKEVNDSLGHPTGDILLQHIGQRLQAAVPATGLVARLGGDEFAVLLPDARVSRAEQLAEELVRVLQVPFLLEDQLVAVDVSIGIAVGPDHGLDADSLLRCADVAMYQAKRSGVGVAVYSPIAAGDQSSSLALRAELQYAIAADELLLHYQPKLDLRDGSLVGVEALVRWQHPQRGFLAPAEFIPLAELSGLIRPLSLWVLEAALRQQAAWRSDGRDIPVAVNLSRRMLHDPHLPETVAELLARCDVPASALVLEITESSLMADPVRASAHLKQLRALGVLVSIDDFGTGYSSLASLKNLPVDELKIDRSFVQAMASDASSRAIVRAIIDLADALKLRVIAEGVEDRATWDLLAGLGCDAAQGYLMSRPIAALEFEAWTEQVGPSWRAIGSLPRPEDPLQERIRGRGARLTAEEEFLARQRSEASLHASEERIRLALQAAHMGTWTWEAGTATLTWSAETEALHGLAPGSFPQTFAALQAAVHPADWPAFHTEMMTSAAERRETVATYRTLWPDGSLHWIDSKGRASYTADGTLERISGTSMDVTQAKVAEEALRASEERFRLQYKGVPLPTYSWLQAGDDFVMQDFNDAAGAIAEGDVSTWIGARASERYVDQPEILADLRTCVTEQRTISRELRFRYPVSGRVRDLALSYVFVPPQTVMLHNHDITERKEAERQRAAMAQSEKLRALGQMASGIAHDLNQSLMLIASYSNLAHRALAQDPPNLVELDDLLTTTTQAAMDGGKTVKRLLQFTRAAPELDRQPVELGAAVREAAHLTAARWRAAPQADGPPISLHLEVLERVVVQGSRSRLRELLTNLIFNAVDALPGGGSIVLRATTDAGQGIIEISDTGIGMPPEVQQRVFEPFFSTKGERGAGLGLTMAFGIVEQHGGRIDVRSTPGQGTTFRIALPLAAALPARLRASASTEAAA